MTMRSYNHLMNLDEQVSIIKERYGVVDMPYLPIIYKNNAVFDSWQTKLYRMTKGMKPHIHLLRDQFIDLIFTLQMAYLYVNKLEKCENVNFEKDKIKWNNKAVLRYLLEQSSNCHKMFENQGKKFMNCVAYKKMDDFETEECFNRDVTTGDNDVFEEGGNVLVGSNKKKNFYSEPETCYLFPQSHLEENYIFGRRNIELDGNEKRPEFYRDRLSVTGTSILHKYSALQNSMSAYQNYQNLLLKVLEDQENHYKQQMKKMGQWDDRKPESSESKNLYALFTDRRMKIEKHSETCGFILVQLHYMLEHFEEMFLAVADRDEYHELHMKQIYEESLAKRYSEKKDDK